MLKPIERKLDGHQAGATCVQVQRLTHDLDDRCAEFGSRRNECIGRLTEPREGGMGKRSADRHLLGECGELWLDFGLDR